MNKTSVISTHYLNVLVPKDKSRSRTGLRCLDQSSLITLSSNRERVSGLLQVALNGLFAQSRAPLRTEPCAVLWMEAKQVAVKPHVHIFTTKVQLYGATAAGSVVELERFSYSLNRPSELRALKRDSLSKVRSSEGKIYIYITLQVSAECNYSES